MEIISEYYHSLQQLIQSVQFGGDEIMDMSSLIEREGLEYVADEPGFPILFYLRVYFATYFSNKGYGFG